MVEPVNTVTQDLRTRLRAAAAGEGDGLRRGLWLSYLDPYGLEVAAGCGADWVGVDLQHGNLEPHALPGLLRVAESVGLPLLARTPSHDPAALGRVLDTGVSGVIIPMDCPLGCPRSRRPNLSGTLAAQRSCRRSSVPQDPTGGESGPAWLSHEGRSLAYQPSGVPLQRHMRPKTLRR
jgi:hypothetical protein